MTVSPETADDAPAGTVIVHVAGVLPERAERLRAIVRQCVASADGGAVTFADGPEELDKAERGMILHPAPAAALAQALTEGVSTTQALRDWRTRANELLVCFRRNRRRAMLIEESAFLEDPHGVLAALGLSVNTDAVPSAGDLAPPRPLQLLIGAELLRRDKAARALAGELEASAAVSDLRHVTPDPDAAHRDYAESVRANARLSELEAEQDAIVRQLHKSQEVAESRRAATESLEEEVETHRQNIARLNAQLHQLRQGLESGERQIEALQAERDELKRENGGLGRALDESHAKLNERQEALEASSRDAEERRAETARLQGELSARFEELSVLTARLEERDATLAERDAEIARFYASKSYRLTAPLRWLRATLTPGG